MPLEYGYWHCRSNITLGVAKTEFGAADVEVIDLHPPYRAAAVAGSTGQQVKFYTQKTAIDIFVLLSRYGET